MSFGDEPYDAWAGIGDGLFVIVIGLLIMLVAIRIADARAHHAAAPAMPLCGGAVASPRLVLGVVNAMALEIQAAGMVVVAINAALLAGIFA